MPSSRNDVRLTPRLLRRVLVAALVGIFPACGISWCTESTVVEEPIRVEFSAETHLGGGRNGGLMRTGYVRIGPDKMESVVSCHQPLRLLEVDDTGARVAYRCAKDAPWTVLHVGAERTFERCGDGAGANEAVDWDRIPLFVDDVGNILACESSGPVREWLFGHILSEAAERDDGTTAKVLRAGASLSFNPDFIDEEGEAWIKAFEALADDQRTKLGEWLRTEVARKDVDAPVLWRALRSLDDVGFLDDEAWRRPLIDRFIGVKEPGAYVSWVLATLLYAHFESTTGEDDLPDVCGIFARPFSPGSSELREAAAWSLARTRSRCEAMIEELLDDPCDQRFNCGEEGKPRACTHEDLRARTEERFSLRPVEAVLMDGNDGLARFAATSSVGAVTEGYMLSQARRFYGRDSRSAYPRCYEIKTPGERCAALGEDDAIDEFVCEVDAETKSVEIEDSQIRLEIDDEAKRISSFSNCRTSGEKCERFRDCCANASCGDGGICVTADAAR